MWKKIRILQPFVWNNRRCQFYFSCYKTYSNLYEISKYRPFSYTVRTYRFHIDFQSKIASEQEKRNLAVASFFDIVVYTNFSRFYAEIHPKNTKKKIHQTSFDQQQAHAHVFHRIFIIFFFWPAFFSDYLPMLRRQRRRWNLHIITSYKEFLVFGGVRGRGKYK